MSRTRDGDLDGVAVDGHVRFTPAGEAALDAMASRLAADAGDCPESIGKVLSSILDADVADLANELTRAVTQQNRSTDLATPDEVVLVRSPKQRLAAAPPEQSVPTPGPIDGRRR